MSSDGYRAWLAAGRPDSGLARPLADLRDVLRGHGYTVYDFPNDAHLTANPPEDHTYFSATGWPGESPRWWRHAIDIMPPPAGSGLPNLTYLGMRLFNDRRDGLIDWLKYMNWPNDGNLDHAVHDSWEPSWSRRPSTDAGHIHLSCVPGVETIPFPPYDPFGGGVVVVSAPGPAPSWTETIVNNLPTLQRGAHNRDVARVQSLVNLWGVGLAVDSDFGPLTDAGVRHVQSACGIEVDGVVGPHTWTALLTR